MTWENRRSLWKRVHQPLLPLRVIVVEERIAALDEHDQSFLSVLLLSFS